MPTTKVRTPGHYEVFRMPLANDYVWVSGEEEATPQPLEKVLHPWRAAYAEWVREDRAHPELQDWMELEEL
jgi:hypothetical protein